MSVDRYLQIQHSRATAYQVLSACYHPPEQGIFEQLDVLMNALQCVCPKSVESVVAMQREVDLDKLTVDFAQLFVGPFKLLAAPYGSVYLEGRREVMGTSTIDALRHYIEAGLEITDSLNDAPDHIAVELEFVYFLVFKEIEATKNGCLDAADEWRRRQTTFLSKHLTVWISQFTDCVEQGATTAFYRNLSKATRLFVTDDAAERLQDVGRQTAIQ